MGVAERIVRNTLVPWAAALEIRSNKLEAEVKASARFTISTRYMKTVVNVEISGDYSRPDAATIESRDWVAISHTNATSSSDVQPKRISNEIMKSPSAVLGSKDIYISMQDGQVVLCSWLS